MPGNTRGPLEKGERYDAPLYPENPPVKSRAEDEEDYGGDLMEEPESDPTPPGISPALLSAEEEVPERGTPAAIEAAKNRIVKLSLFCPGGTVAEETFEGPEAGYEWLVDRIRYTGQQAELFAWNANDPAESIFFAASDVDEGFIPPLWVPENTPLVLRLTSPAVGFTGRFRLQIQERKVVR